MWRHVHSGQFLDFVLHLVVDLHRRLQGSRVEQELVERIEHLPSICSELADGDRSPLSALKPAIDFYLEFLAHFHPASKVDHDENVSLIKYLIDNGNTTVYQWRTGGHRPVSIERPTLNYKLAESTQVNRNEAKEGDGEGEANLILGLDDDNDDLTKSIDGIEVKQTSEQIDFDLVGRATESVLSSSHSLPCLGSRNRLVCHRHRA